MGAVAPIKNGRKAPIKIPSFVFRQDGCELSYEVEAIIDPKPGNVKQKALSPCANSAPYVIARRAHKEVFYPKKKTCFIRGWAPVTGSISITITSFIYSFQRSTTGLSACTLAANSTLLHS